MDKKVVKIIVTGARRYRLLDLLIKKDIECERVTDKNEQLILYTHRSNEQYISILAEGLSCEVRLCEREGKNKSLKSKLLMHSGLIFGLVISALVCYYFAGVILRINIENDDPKIKADIISVLNENGLHIGSLKKDFDFIKLERELKGKVDGISWAGISVQGSTLVVDTINNIPIPESDNKRMPCNVIALYDSVIDKTEVFCGELKVSSGSAVRAGDIIISGEQTKLIKVGKDDKETEVKSYIRADGRVYGTFYKYAEFYYPYEETINTPTGKAQTVSYLNIFDTDIPLFFSKPEGNYSYKATKKPLKLFGRELPLAVTDVEYSEFTEALNTYTDEMIDEKIEKSAANYEEEILDDYEIIDSKRDISRTDKGVKVKLEYTLYGEIGEQVDIYLNKQ